MDPRKEKMIKKAILRVCQKQERVPQGEMPYRVSDELAAKTEISEVITKMIDYGELAMTTAWEIKIADKNWKQVMIVKDDTLKNEIIEICKKPHCRGSIYWYIKNKFPGIKRERFYSLITSMINLGTLELTLNWKIQAPGKSL